MNPSQVNSIDEQILNQISSIKEVVAKLSVYKDYESKFNKIDEEVNRMKNILSNQKEIMDVEKKYQNEMWNNLRTSFSERLLRVKKEMNEFEIGYLNQRKEFQKMINDDYLENRIKQLDQKWSNKYNTLKVFNIILIVAVVSLLIFQIYR